MNFKPAPGLILVEPIEDDEATTISHVKADDVEEPKKGKVLAFGDTYISEFNAEIESPVYKDDIILHATTGYEQFTQDYKKYRVVKFTHVLGVL